METKFEVLESNLKGNLDILEIFWKNLLIFQPVCNRPFKIRPFGYRPIGIRSLVNRALKVI